MSRLVLVLLLVVVGVGGVAGIAGADTLTPVCVNYGATVILSNPNASAIQVGIGTGVVALAPYATLRFECAVGSGLAVVRYTGQEAWITEIVNPSEATTGNLLLGLSGLASGVLTAGAFLKSAL